MNKSRHLFISFLFVSLISNISFAQYTSNQIDSIINQAMTRFNVAGVAVAVVKDGAVIHSKGYGVKSVVTKSPVDKHTNFAIASNSKAFTTTALALLVEEGKLSWHDKVTDYIPEFKMYDSYVTENFNIEDLLTHRSGLGLGVGDLMFFPDGSDFTIDDLLGSFQHFKPVSAFRTQFDYDNLLYLVAGELIKRVSGLSYEDFITQRIFQPLEMANTYADLGRITDTDNLATPHSSDEKELKPLPNYKEMVNAAAGGIYSNVDDLTKWMLVHLNKGKYGDKLKDTLFTEASQREMWKLHSLLEPSKNPRYKSHFAGYGLGWALSDIQGNMMVDHTGGLPGMLSKTVLVPDMNLGIIILTNTADDGAGLFASVSKILLDGYLELEPVDWIEKYAVYLQARKMEGDSVTKAVWRTVKKVKKNIILENNIIGVYEDNWFGKIEVFRKGNVLWIKAHRSPKLNGQMYFYKANTFAVKWEYQDMNADAFAMFSLDENGKATRLKMKGISPEIDFSFDFQDLDLKRIDNQ